MAKRIDTRRGGKGGFIGELLPGVVDKYRLQKKMALYQLFDRWPEVVGPQLVKKCQPLFIKRKTLHVKVVNHAWMHQLYFFQDRIIDRFNDIAAGKIFITHLHFELGEIEEVKEPGSEPREGSRPPRLVGEREKKQIKKEICRHVKDPELAEILYQLRLKDRIQRLLN
ncbi:MAG: hypothetical protein DRH04_02850 [Deltaproteobacteria bacterium]|nr:MAG: hypothetical protein DRH04_02850 [Deltaproteobacteria bacterium]